MNTKPKPYTKVRCISKDCSAEKSIKEVEIGEVYTVDEPMSASSLGERQITLIEINDKVRLQDRRPIFRIEDFEIYDESQELNDDYDRAMKILL